MAKRLIARLLGLHTPAYVRALEAAWRREVHYVRPPGVLYHVKSLDETDAMYVDTPNPFWN